MTSSTTRALVAKKQNLLFNQLTAMPKRLAMVLTVLFTLGVGQMWGAHTVVKASEMVSGEKYIITAVYNSKTYYLKPTNFSAGSSTAVEYSANLTEAAAWTFTKSGNIWEISTTISGTTYYLGHNATNNGVKSVNPKADGDYTIVASTSGANTVKMTANSRDLALYQSSNWRCYSSNSGVKTITLYKVESATPTLTATPTSLDFGTVAQNASITAKTFSISGSNLTSGQLSITAPDGYSVSPASVNVNGTLSSTDITVTPNTSTAGTYNGNITISGGGLTSNVIVGVKMTVQEVHTVTWVVNGAVYETVNDILNNSKVTAPTVSPIPCGDVIAGWTDAENGNYVHGTSALYSGATPSIQITNNITFYAVFADYED